MTTISFDEAELNALAERVATKVADALAKRPAERFTDTPDWFTAAAAGKYLGFTVKTLEEWRRKGRGPKWNKLNGRSVRYARADLDSFATASRRKA
jgi:hypothetical protein